MTGSVSILEFGVHLRPMLTSLHNLCLPDLIIAERSEAELERGRGLVIVTSRHGGTSRSDTW